MSKQIVLAGGVRTAIGKFGGALANTPAAEMGAIVIKEALQRAGIKPEQVDEVIMGCVLQAGQGQSVARQAAVKAGLPGGSARFHAEQRLRFRPEGRQPCRGDD